MSLVAGAAASVAAAATRHVLCGRRICWMQQLSRRCLVVGKSTSCQVKGQRLKPLSFLGSPCLIRSMLRTVGLFLHDLLRHLPVSNPSIDSLIILFYIHHQLNIHYCFRLMTKSRSCWLWRLSSGKMAESPASSFSKLPREQETINLIR